MRFWILRVLPILAAIHNAADVTAIKGKRSSPSLAERSAPTILTPDFVNAVQKIVDAKKIPGLTLAIVYKDKQTEFGAWGIKSEDGTNMTTDTLFNIGSCSKAFLSASLGILIDDFAHGRNTTPLPPGLSTLTWDTKLAAILPDAWKLMDDWASQKANLIDILSHVSGLQSHDLSYKVNSTVDSVTRNLRNLRPTYELRQQFLYNNQMYMVGSYVVSVLSGMRYADFVTSRIFKPLGMTSSTYSIDAAIQTGRFTDTWTEFGRLIPSWMEDEFEDLMAGPGGVISSVEELTPWVRVMLNGGVDPETNVTIIPPEQFDIITSAHSIVGSSANDQSSTALYGLGWIRFSSVGIDIITHTGGAPGVSTAIAAALEDGLAVIGLANASLKQSYIYAIISEAVQKAMGLANANLKQPSIYAIILETVQKAIGFANANLKRPSIYAIIPEAVQKAFSLAASSSPLANQSTVSRRDLPPTVAARTDGAASPSYSDLAGTYFNAGYGTAELCSVESTSPSCQSVLNDFRSIDKSLSANSMDLFVSWKTPFSSNFRLTANGTQYVLFVGSIYPEGYGKNSTPFSTLGAGAIAKFVVENESVIGFGVFSLDKDEAGSVEETSDIWFVKQE